MKKLGHQNYRLCMEEIPPRNWSRGHDFVGFFALVLDIQEG